MTLKRARLGWNRFPKSLQSYKKKVLVILKWVLVFSQIGEHGDVRTFYIQHPCFAGLEPPSTRATSDSRAGILSHDLIFGVAVLLQRPWNLDSQNKQEVLIPVFHRSCLSKKMIQMKLCGRVFVLKQAHLCQLKASFRAFLSASTSGDFMCLFIERRRPGIVGSWRWGFLIHGSFLGKMKNALALKHVTWTKESTTRNITVTIVYSELLIALNYITF